LRSPVSGLSVEELAVSDARRALDSRLEKFRESVDRWTPFHDPSYLSLWARVLGPRDGCQIVVAWDGSGDLAAYAPLMRVRGRVGPLPVPTLRFIGNNIGLPGDILHAEVFATERERAAVAAILRHVASTWSLGKWELGYLSPSSPTWRAASEILGDGFVAPSTFTSVPFVSVDLPADWDTYFASLTSNTRNVYRRGLRHLEAQGQVKVVVDVAPEGARRRVEELIRNHLRWFAGTEKGGWLGDRAERTFLVSSSELLAHEGQFLSSALELNGTPIAWIVGATYGRTSFEHLSSYDRTYSEDSVGLVLGLELMRELISRGFRRVDLGPGSALFKKRLGGVESPYGRVLGYQGWTRRAAWVQALLERRRGGTRLPVGAS
jgi:hypothetical protein